jgi:hypothetical protein
MNFYIVISTCPGYESALVGILKSIPPDMNYIVVYSKSQEESYEIVGNRINVFIPKNLYEYTAWLGVESLIKNCVVNPTDWFLFTHDTTVAGDNFKKKFLDILCILHKTPIDYYSLANGGFHNISLCRRSGLKNICNYLGKIETMTKEEARNLEGKLPTLMAHGEIGEYYLTPEICIAEGPKSKSYLVAVDIYKYFT